MDIYLEQQNQLLIRKALEYCYDLISFQDLKDFSVFNVTNYLDSEDPTIAKLIREIEGSVVRVEENLLKEEEFKSNLQNFLNGLPHKEDKWTASSVNQVNWVTTYWESGLPAPALTTYEEAVVA